jgi:hypothetical protein
MYFVFCRLYPFSASHHGSVWLLSVISLLLTYTVSLVFPYSWRGFESGPPSILSLYYRQRQVEDGISVLYLFDHSPSCDVYIGVEHHHQMIGSNRAHVFGFLSSSPFLPQPLRQWLTPTCHLSTLNLHCIAGAACLSILLKRFRVWSS